MPKVGDITRGKELGNKDAKHKFIWAECPHCHRTRWVRIPRMSSPTIKTLVPCAHCNGILPRSHPPLTLAQRKHLSDIRSGEKSVNWRGGRFISTHGYVLIWLPKTDFFYPMANKNGNVFEHRLIMAKHLQRCLHSWEVIHHIDRNKQNNCLSNLSLTDISSHNGLTSIVKQNIFLHKENTQLRKLLSQNDIPIPTRYRNRHRKEQKSAPMWSKKGKE